MAQKRFGNTGCYNISDYQTFWQQFVVLILTLVSKKKNKTNSRQPGLTWCDEAVLWFFFDLMVLLLVLVSFSFAASVCSCALRCDRSVDCVCRWLTFLQHQVHGLRGEK